MDRHYLGKKKRESSKTHIENVKSLGIQQG